jgi:putative oxidoreductase
MLNIIPLSFVLLYVPPLTHTIKGGIMNTWSNIKRYIFSTADDNKLIFIRLIVGLIFISEGIQKFLSLEIYGSAFFNEIGFQNAFFWAYFTGTFEVFCGILLLLGYLTRLASIPLMAIMITAFVKTKLPLLVGKGFWIFAHEYRIDFSMTILLILLFIHGAGKWSVDLRLFKIYDSDNKP